MSTSFSISDIDEHERARRIVAFDCKRAKVHILPCLRDLVVPFLEEANEREFGVQQGFTGSGIFIETGRLGMVASELARASTSIEGFKIEAWARDVKDLQEEILTAPPRRFGEKKYFKLYSRLYCWVLPERWRHLILDGSWGEG